MGIQINGTNDTITTNDGTISIDGSTTLTGSLTGTTGVFSGDVGVAGTLTSEDKTNIDSVGLITARTGIKVGPITGVAATHYADGSIRTTGIITAANFYGNGANLTGIDATQIVTGNTSVQTVDTGSDGHVKVTTEGTERFRITNDGKYYFTGTGGGSGSRGLEIDTESVGAADEGVILNARASGTTGRIKLQTNSATAMTILGNGGNIGINTVTPAGASGKTLDISGGSGQARLAFHNDTTGYAAGDGHQIYSDGLTFGIQNREAGNTVFETNGSERLRINSAGNMGLGETDISPVGGTYKAFDIAYKGTGLSGRTDNPTLNIRSNIYYNGSAWKYGEGNTTAGVLNIGGGQVHFYHAPSGTAGNTATLTEVFNINDDGSMLWGTTNTGNLTAGGVKVQTAAVNGEAIALNLRNPDITAAGNAAVSIDFNMDRSPSGGIHFRAGTISCKKEQNWTTSASTVDSRMQFYVTQNESRVERMCITSAGIVEINGMFCAGKPGNFGSVSSTQGCRITGQQGSHPACLSFDGGGTPTLEMGSKSGETIIGSNSYNGSPMNFKSGMNIATLTGGTTRFQINSNGNIGAPTGNNIYNASDERLKENIVELTDGLNKVEKLKPISFTWKEGWDVNLDGITQYGFGAQTTEAVDELLVEPFSTEDIELDGETIENPLRVNEKYIIPLLVKAVQELSAKVSALES